MKKTIKVMKKLFRTILTVVILWSGIYAYTVYVNPSNTQTPQEVCGKLHEFYLSSWYTNKWEYVKDMELLQDFEQKALDELSYKDTVLRTKWEQIDNKRLNYLDETIQLNLDWQAKVEKPEYLEVNWATTTKKETLGTWFDFLKLLK